MKRACAGLYERHFFENSYGSHSGHRRNGRRRVSAAALPRFGSRRDHKSASSSLSGNGRPGARHPRRGKRANPGSMRREAARGQRCRLAVSRCLTHRFPTHEVTMPLFTTLFPLTKRAALTVLIVAEGDQLRVNVMPKSKDGSEEKTIYPLSLLASPEELDRDFAEAVSIYEPGSQSVLDQARAASAANNNGEAPKARPAPSKGKGGRKRAAELPPPDASGNGPNAGAAGD